MWTRAGDNTIHSEDVKHINHWKIKEKTFIYRLYSLEKRRGFYRAASHWYNYGLDDICTVSDGATVPACCSNNKSMKKYKLYQCQ